MASFELVPPSEMKRGGRRERKERERESEESIREEIGQNRYGERNEVTSTPSTKGVHSFFF